LCEVKSDPFPDTLRNYRFGKRFASATAPQMADHGQFAVAKGPAKRAITASD
jgi:hypothetical protein